MTTKKTTKKVTKKKEVVEPVVEKVTLDEAEKIIEEPIIEVKPEKLMYGGEYPVEVTKVEDIKINGTSVKKISLANGTTTICSLEDYPKNITKI